MDYKQLSALSEGKTRVILFGLHPKISQLIRYVLDYHEKEYDYVSSEEAILNGKDFFILETDDANAPQHFPPTIIFIGSQSQTENYSDMLASITQGGILVYPDFVMPLEHAVYQSLNYFRKMGYKAPDAQISDFSSILNTDFGKVKIALSDKEILKDIDGAKYFCQQLGIMEDEFYDAVSVWE